MVRAVAALAAAAAVAGACGAPDAGAKGGWRWPVGGELVTAYRFAGAPYAGGEHRGIDVAAPVGAAVVAAAPGTVRFAGVAGSSGLTISVRTADGRFDTSYLHLSRIAVRAGEAVAAGTAIGAVGTSGRRSTAAAHLHFGVRAAGSRHGYRDPLGLLPPRGPVRERPRAAPVRAPDLRPAPPPVLVSARPPRFRTAPSRLPRFRAAPSPVSSRARPSFGWAIACLALLIAAALAGRTRPSGRRSVRTSRSSIGARAVLRHHTDLLRQR